MRPSGHCSPGSTFGSQTRVREQCGNDKGKGGEGVVAVGVGVAGGIVGWYYWNKFVEEVSEAPHLCMRVRGGLNACKYHVIYPCLLLDYNHEMSTLVHTMSCVIAD